MKENRQLPHFLKSFPEKDWFVYADQEIKGPFFARDLYKLANYDSHGEKILITQKKQNRWYELAEARSKASKADELPKSSARKLSRLVTAKLKRATRSPEQQHGQALLDAAGLFSEVTNTQSKPQVVAKTIKKSRKNRKRVQAKQAQSVFENRLNDKNTDKPFPSVLRQTETTKTPAKATEDRVVEPAVTKPEEFSLDENALYSQLRLGKKRGLATFCCAVGTAGLFNFFWYQKLCREAFFHATGVKIKGLRLVMHGLFSILPVFSVYSFGKLLGVIQELEKQNNYEHSRVKSLWLSLFPSLLLLRYQKALNMHWALLRDDYSASHDL